MTPFQMVLTVAYIGGITLLVTYGYRLLFRFARGGEAATLTSTPARKEAEATGVREGSLVHRNEAVTSASEEDPTMVDAFIERFFPKVASVLACFLILGFAWLMSLQWAPNGALPIRVSVFLAIAVALPALFYRDLWRGRTWALSTTAGVAFIATLMGVILFLRGPEIRVIIGAAFWATLTYLSGRIVRDRFRRARRT